MSRIDSQVWLYVRMLGQITAYMHCGPNTDGEVFARSGFDVLTVCLFALDSLLRGSFGHASQHNHEGKHQDHGSLAAALTAAFGFMRPIGRAESLHFCLHE